MTYVPSSSSSTHQSHPRSILSSGAVLQDSGRAAIAKAAVLHTKRGVLVRPVVREVVLAVCRITNLTIVLPVLIVLVY